MYCIPLNDTTEARYAEIARKMLETKDWITLWHDYGLPFWAKPPLSTWLSALSMQFFGINEFSVRLPSLILSITILGLLGNFIKKYTDAESAKLSILILASSLFFFIDAGAVMTDPSLLFCTTLACLSFWEAFVNADKIWGYLFFASIGLGLLAKGPLILVLAGLPIISWLLFYKQQSRLWSNLPWISGILLVAAIALPWYILAEYQTPGFLHYFIVGEHFGRFLIPGWAGDKYGFAHHQPLGMIWIYFIIGTLPWSIAALYLAALYKRKWLGNTYTFLLQNPLFGYLAFWLFMPLLFFTFARNIIYTYSFTALPAAALIIAIFSVSVCEYNKRKKIFFLLAIGLGMLSLLVSAASITLPEKVNNTQKLIISTWNKVQSNPKDKIFYWSNSKSYSAEFYSKGKVTYISSVIDLQKYIFDPRIYLVINQIDLKFLPKQLLPKMTRICSDKKKILLLIKA